MFQNEDIVNLTLNDDLSASAYYCESGSQCDKPDPAKSTIIKGKWTTVYDQALKVELENGLRFLSNFRYNAKETLTKDPLKDELLGFVSLSTGDYGSFDSDCGKTMVGFVQSIPSITGEKYTMTEHKAQCFVGNKSTGKSASTNLPESAPATASVSNANSEPVVHQIEASSPEDTATVQLNSAMKKKSHHKKYRKAHNKRRNLHHEHKPSDEMDLLIETINDNYLGWKADKCKL